MKRVHATQLKLTQSEDSNVRRLARDLFNSKGSSESAQPRGELRNCLHQLINQAYQLGLEDGKGKASGSETIAAPVKKECGCFACASN